MSELFLKRHAPQGVGLPARASQSEKQSSLSKDSDDEFDIKPIIDARLESPAGDSDELLFLPGTSREDIFKRLLRLRDEARAAQRK